LRAAALTFACLPAPRPPAADDDVEALTLELIQMMTLLLKHVPTALLGPHRKALLHTSWRWVQVGRRLGWRWAQHMRLGQCCLQPAAAAAAKLH
jgi:hypothetical protein